MFKKGVPMEQVDFSSVKVEKNKGLRRVSGTMESAHP